jgi:RNA polymerase sigma-70 factor (ECF subfamily)
VDVLQDTGDWSQAVAGDGEAFGRIFDRNRRAVRRQAARFLSSPHDVEDAVAVVFLEAWRRRDAVRLVDGSVLPWLLVTAVHVTANIRRSSRRYQALLAHLPEPPTAPDPATSLDESGALAALRRLSLPDQQVLTLCVLEGWSERDAATALRVRPGTVKSRLHRAKLRLAALVAPPTPQLGALSDDA